jgi:aspartyl-tRNA(Asn)/glutamyl-tRNA(Gln) amidotransferase subunit A
MAAATLPAVPDTSPSAATPWLGDACSLVDAFRAGELSPVEVLDACLEAIDASALNAVSHTDPEGARQAAARADVALPFGGVPMGVKELHHVEGWPYTHASVPFRGQVSEFDSTHVRRLRDAGAVLVGLTTASEFGGVNLTRTRLNGITRNPWGPARTPGGSSGGAAAAVAGGLVPIGTGGDGGGSIRIPAAFCGLPGLKVTYGRFPKGPWAELGNVTSVPGCLARSVRDTARWLDVCNGHDPHDPLSLPRVEGWEAGLGSHLDELRGLRVAVDPTLGGAIVHPDVQEAVAAAADALLAATGLRRVDVDIRIPPLDTAWALSGLVGIRATLGDRWPACADDLTPQIAFGLRFASEAWNLEGAARVEQQRVTFVETMAALFDEVDLVIAATNPDVAFAAEGPLPTRVGEVDTGPGNNGALTIPSNIYGNPAVSIPVGTVPSGDGTDLPVGMQVLGRHHAEALLLDLALVVERDPGWPLVAPDAPC